MKKLMFFIFILPSSIVVDFTFTSWQLALVKNPNETLFSIQSPLPPPHEISKNVISKREIDPNLIYFLKTDTMEFQ